MPLSKNREYRFPSARATPDLAAHLQALAEDVDLDMEARVEDGLQLREEVTEEVEALAVRVPETGDMAGYEQVTMNEAGRLAYGLTTEGVNHAPRILTEKVEYAEGPSTEVADYPGYSRLSLRGGRMAEDALDDKGNVPDDILARWASRWPGGGLGPIHLLIVAGQSNATKRGDTTEATNATAYDEGRVLRWSHNSGAIILETGTNWLGSGFAREWIKNNPSKRILIVEAAVGSTGFWSTSLDPAPAGYSKQSGTWDRTLTADPVNYPETLLRRRVADASAAAAALTGVEPPKIAMLWCQGENDTGHASEYQAKLDDLFSWARALWGVPNLPILVASMTPATIRRTNGGTALDRIHQDTPRRIPLTAYHRGPEALEENTANRTHYQPIAQEERGADIAARLLARAWRNKDAKDAALAVVPPGRASIARAGNSARVSWEHPPCRFTALTLETSTDAGATWTVQELAVPGAVEHTLTVPYSSPLWARLATVNGSNTSYYREVAS